MPSEAGPAVPQGNPIVGAEYDLPAFVGRRCFYVIAESPRSGSQLLADLLWRTGRMGAPGEYFNMDRTVPGLSQRLGCGPVTDPGGVDAYLRAVIRHRTTPNGVFGLKAHFAQLRPFLAGRTTRELMRRGHFVWLRRRDTLAQAISYVFALRSGQWRLPHGAEKAPAKVDYSTRLVDRALSAIAGDERAWQIAFEHNRVAPLEVWYEDLVADPDSICRDICRLVGVEDAGPFRLSDSLLQRQAGPLNERWRARHAAGLDWTSSVPPGAASGPRAERHQEDAADQRGHAADDVEHRLVGEAAGQRVDDLIDRRVGGPPGEDEQHRADAQ